MAANKMPSEALSFRQYIHKGAPVRGGGGRDCWRWCSVWRK
ncbi:hypothetical protein COI10_11875 [Neisseria meningitidis]|nr:hypothetical protein COI37_11930 [Neisseria meningitidis]RNJ91654.1 hypothetical protein COI32_11505 [Neisseria meningitidis]RNK04650.1 hypothetical protein COI27_11800 [Neisseria meningitidis]RNK23182.1 hypothetical protein COH95_11255 [Neisseria meningitidis]RNK28818.1 hypothetical protein COH98_11390 [Neisseria meningitidis]